MMEIKESDIFKAQEAQNGKNLINFFLFPFMQQMFRLQFQI